MCKIRLDIDGSLGGGSFDFGSIAYSTPNDFVNPYGCWSPFKVGNGSQMMIYVDCNNFDTLKSYMREIRLNSYQ